MSRHLIFIALFLIASCQFGMTQNSDPVLTTNSFSKTIQSNDTLDCKTVNDLGVIVPITDEVKKYDLIVVKFMCHYKSEEIMDLAYFELPPFPSKEYEVKYGGKDELKLWLIDPSNPSIKADFTSTGRIIYGDIKHLFCYHKAYHTYYAITIGFIKTGSHYTKDYNGNVSKVNDYDRGTILGTSGMVNHNLSLRKKKKKKKK